MTWYLGGQMTFKTGWLAPTVVYVDFLSDFVEGWLWQLYANRKLIGRTTSPGTRRIVGQLNESNVPAPLTLIRVAPENILNDYGPELPRMPWNRFAVSFEADADPDLDTTKFEITGSAAAGEAVDPDNVLVTEPFVGLGVYRVELPPLGGSGLWTYEITPRDNAQPFGNAGTPQEFEIDAIVMPPDLRMDEDGNRFTLSAEAGVVTVGFEFGE
jgi:hypothetical protein